MMPVRQRLLPDLTDPPTAPFWAGLRERKLLVQRCPQCGTRRYPSAPLCPRCLHRGAEWTEIAPTGFLWSYAVYHRDLSGAFADDIPYAIGVAEVTDRLHILARIAAPLADLAVGAAVQAEFHDTTGGVTLLRWVLADQAAARHG
jgi:uncharacterized OB-fold protein